MLKTSGIVKLTLLENLRGQLLWASAIAGGLLLFLMATLSGITLSHESRVIDVFSYFIADQLLLFVAVISGSNICSLDFSSRGVAELFIPAGIHRNNLYLARFFAFSCMLLVLALPLFALKIFVLPKLAEGVTATEYKIQLTMLLFAWLKSLTALSIAGLLGSLVRPLYAILGVITLYSVGHLTSSFDSLLSAPQAISGVQETSKISSVLYTALKVWNPNLLVVDSIKGEWILPDSINFAIAVLWAVSFICLPLGLTFVSLKSRDVRS
ncbi:MAG: hypothetical protein EBR09_06170 [Proteobacteria bacterium]|nr:hypothetical protein [Pseudomonadota bacterium]